jgi:hypothetical protein
LILFAGSAGAQGKENVEKFICLFGLMSEFVFDIVICVCRKGDRKCPWQSATWKLKWFAGLAGYHLNVVVLQ